MTAKRNIEISDRQCYSYSINSEKKLILIILIYFFMDEFCMNIRVILLKNETKYNVDNKSIYISFIILTSSDSIILFHSLSYTFFFYHC